MLIQKLQIVRQEVGIPISEQSSYVSRIYFLNTAIQNSHYKILRYINNNQKELLEGEIMSMNELTHLRVAELQKLRSIVDRNRTEITPPKILLQRLEAEIKALDTKHQDFLKEVELVQSKKTIVLPPTKFTEELDYLHNQVLDTASTFVTHNQKELEEARQLVDFIKQNSLQLMYLILVTNVGVLFASIIFADILVLESMEKIKCPPRN